MKILISDEEREKAKITLQTVLKAMEYHGSREPYMDLEAGTYDGDMELIYASIVQAFRHGAQGVLNAVSPEEKARLLNQMM